MQPKTTYLLTRPNGFSIRTLLVQAASELDAILAATNKTGQTGNWAATPLSVVLGDRDVAVSVGLDDSDGLEALLDADPDVADAWYDGKRATG